MCCFVLGGSMKNLKATILAALLVATYGVGFAHGDKHVSNFDKTAVVGDYEIEYPVLTLDTPKATKEANKIIRKVVHQEVFGAMNEKAIELDTSYKVTYEDPEVISILYSSYVYRQGDAHGMTNQIGIVINKNTGERITLEKYINIGSMGEVFQALKNGKAKLYNKHMKEINFDPKFNDGSVTAIPVNFFIDKDGDVALVFQPAVLSAYADGPTRVKFI